MPFEIVRNDIVNMQVDVVVNTANPNPVIGSGVDSGIHKKAGHELLAARQKIGCIEFGDAVITPGFGLDAKYVIHTVGPIWEDGNHGEEQILSSCYRKSLALAKEHECESIAFPLIATGNYDFPKPLALQSAVREISTFLLGLDAGFSETLLQLIDRTGKKDSEIYKKANVDRKLFSKIRNNMDYKPSKTTALAFALALELDVDETKDFIGRAGFALSHSSKFEVIVEYFLVNRNYNVFELNEVLFAFDQPLIGA